MDFLSKMNLILLSGGSGSRLWGEYKVFDYQVSEDGENCLTKELIVSSRKHISYQRHSHRTEIWTFVKGEGRLILDGVARQVKRGDVAYIKPGVKHAIIADTDLHFIEVQVGDELTEEAIESFCCELQLLPGALTQWRQM